MKTGFALAALAALLTGPAATGQYPAAYPASFIRVPTTGAAWVDPEDPPPPPRPAAGDDRLERIEKKLDRLLELLEKAVGGEQPDRGASPKDEEVFLQNLGGASGTCVNCHAPDNYKAKGDGFQLLEKFKDEDGKWKLALRENFSRSELRALIKKVSSGDMPKRGKLTTGQKEAFLAEMDARLKKIEGPRD